MKTGYKKAIEVLFTEYEKLKSENADPDDIKSIREGIEYLCYPFREDLTENIRSPIQDPDVNLYLDKADRSTQEQEKIFWQNMTGLSQKNIETTLYAIETLKKL